MVTVTGRGDNPSYTSINPTFIKKTSCVRLFNWRCNSDDDHRGFSRGKKHAKIPEDKKKKFNIPEESTIIFSDHDRGVQSPKRRARYLRSMKPF